MEEKKYLKRKEKAFNDGNREQLAIACNNLGDFYNQQGRYQNAVKEYQEEASIYARMGKKLETAKAHRMVGEMYMLLCEFDHGKEHINDYLKIAKKLQNKVEEQRAYTTLGRAHLLHGQALADTSASNAMTQLKHAEKAFLKSLLLTKELTGQISKLEQLDMQARCYLNIGVVKEHMEEFDEAISYMEKALKISKSHDIFELTHMCYVSMSLMYHSKRNDATLALRYCNMALDVAKRFSQKVKKICETLIIKSEILVKAGDFASAKQILTKAYKKNTPDENDRTTIEKTLRIVVKICQILDELITTSSIDYAKRKALYEKLGDGCCHLGNYTKALEYYRKMLECAQLNKEPPKSLIPIYVSLYQTYKDNKEYDHALEFLWKEYELNKDVHNEAFSTLCSIAEICELQMQSFWTIQDIYQKAKDHASKAGDVRTKLEKIAYARLRKLQIKHNMNVLAEEMAQEAISKGIDLNSLDDESDTESDGTAINENNTPDLGEDICLDDLTDSDTSDLDETEKPRPHRATRGTRSLTIKRNNKGETQLHQACIAGNIELVRRLIDQGHVVNVRDHAGWLPLHEASNHGFRDIVQLLLDRGAAVAINDKGGTSCDGITPLYDACSNGYLDVVELLLERGADATVKTDYGETCLSGLDKWRSTATLTEGEQVEYEQIRARLIKTLSKVGICQTQSSKPLTNANTETKRKPQEHSKETSTIIEELESEMEEIDEAENIRPSTSRFNRSKEKTKTRSPASASVEYKNAIEQLKHPHHRNAMMDSDSDSYTTSESGKNKRSAYLDAEEIDEDSWLIDDLGPERKKRRYQTTPTKNPRPMCSVSKTHYKSPAKDHTHHSIDSGNATWLRDSLTPENDAFQVLLDAATGTTSQQRQKQAKKLSLSRSSSISSNASIATSSQRQKPKHQSSLLESGFCRFRSESPLITSDDSNDAHTAVNMRTTEPDSTTTSIQLLISPSKSSPIKVQATPLTLPTTVSFKVKVEEELLLVPVDRKKISDINIRWLAEEASRRYYNLVGLKPLLRLKTADGFAYEENDPINVALEQNMILATVLEWQISPLGQRYEEMCIQLHKVVNSDVQDVLQRAQISNSIYLTDFWLTPLQIEPIFKAILHQTNLRILDLSNNFIQNEGCRLLAKSLPTLKQLKALNLKGNFITADGLESLLFCPGIEKLCDIEELVLSQNPLGNTSLRMLDRFCNSASGKSLQKLHISQCNLTQLYDYDFAFYQLVDFDISFNQLNDDSIRKLLSKLNSCRLQSLNLSYIKMELSDDDRLNLVLADKLAEFFESGTCEKFKNIELVGCQLSDVNIYKIVQCLSRANDLELFNISNNVRLSSSSLHFILDKLPQLRKLVAINCTNLIEADKVERLAHLKQIPNYISITLSSCDLSMSCLNDKLCQLWQEHWGDRGKIKSFDNNLILYTNDKDLSDI
ncbi:tonsoku-like protein [Lucilia cuprina]|uniref:tonsoku-like protein n=1 Tax=Lucilia cuprina TaxID=7375 RepID=UPI001F06953F|nr:tonsoku-like protein [Lucilia cuprina]